MPSQYPTSVQDLYDSTPDECVADFYHNARVLSSCHDGMADLQLAAWAASAEELAGLHRCDLALRCHDALCITITISSHGCTASRTGTCSPPPS